MSQRFARSVVIGKFLPPHLGHKRLIDTALAQSEQVTVLVCDSPAYGISAVRRVEWLREIHPDAIIKIIPKGNLKDIDSPAWAAHTIKTLGYVPDAVFTSESYGEPYARAMGCVHVAVDPPRVVVPISGTAVRADPSSNVQFLEPCVRVYYVPRVVVVGAESSGKTALVGAVATHYGEPWVPEYGSLYREGKGLARPWNSQEFVHIAQMQNALQEQLARKAEKLLLCDGDAFSVRVWHDRYVGMGYPTPVLDALADEQIPLLYILSEPDIAIPQEGACDAEMLRNWIHERFRGELRRKGVPFVIVSGEPQTRLVLALSSIDAAMSAKEVGAEIKIGAV